MRNACKKIAAFLAALGLFSCGGASGGGAVGGSSRLAVTVTLFPLYDFAREIGGDRVELHLLVPPGADAHSFEPAPRDMVRLSRPGVFIYTGAAMEPWVRDFLAGVENPELHVIEAARGIGFAAEMAGNFAEEGREDPHVWLDLAYAQEMVNTIAEGLAAASQGDGEFFRERGRLYGEKLAALDEKLLRAVQGFRQKTLVFGGHFAFGYFVRRYGLDYISPYAGSGANTEPGPRRILQTAAKLKELGLSHVFYEEMAEPRLAGIIAREAGAELLLLHGAHTVTREELEGGVSFLELMERNLANLKTALE
ncbi:MAG: zinc ABC transporter substrate-binding protein [Spirochaetales bacterium]|jgi:zinc transport system substrate-binding protein|nr:zinc ABC transporter substrate-binding protein [Spirochaetales bacterium]